MVRTLPVEPWLCYQHFGEEQVQNSSKPGTDSSTASSSLHPFLRHLLGALQEQVYREDILLLTSGTLDQGHLSLLQIPQVKEKQTLWKSISFTSAL